MTTKDTLIKKLKDKEAHIAILGLGYVGLPLAVVFGKAGYNVTGIDPDTRKVDSLNKGVSYIPDVETEVVAALVKSGNLTATTDFSVLKEYAMRSASVSRRHCARPVTRTCRSSCLRPMNWRNISTRIWSSCWNQPPIRARRAKSCSRC